VFLLREVDSVFDGVGLGADNNNLLIDDGGVDDNLFLAGSDEDGELGIYAVLAEVIEVIGVDLFYLL
jgi:hypothetical protein